MGRGDATPIVTGTIRGVMPAAGCGLIRSLDGQEYLFQRQHAAAFDQLAAGVWVTFRPCPSAIGWQAADVQPIVGK